MLYWSLLTKIFSDITGRCWCGYHDNKRHAGWKSTTVAEGYVENSIENKTKIANQVLVGTTTSAITKTVNVSETPNGCVTTLCYFTLINILFKSRGGIVYAQISASMAFVNILFQFKV
ncbi:hypothetical protein NQ317_000514 [Molorchus minor]|uniref:Transmembrane protein n=1 Tax=Molorchus minor TaxID=1323400 RepID=A0ABQ9ISJ1_9CUCU|nr:hypothetical protein NQ317_000514 [Molorchus minor]